jgi:hypothetical protein
MIAITGPKISCSKQVMPGCTSVSTVGGKKDLAERWISKRGSDGYISLRKSYEKPTEFHEI